MSLLMIAWLLLRSFRAWDLYSYAVKRAIMPRLPLCVVGMGVCKCVCVCVCMYVHLVMVVGYLNFQVFSLLGGCV